VESHLPKAETAWWGRCFLGLAGGYGALAVGLGAYRAHGLKNALQAAGVDPIEITDRVANLGIAVDYTLIHVVAIVALLAMKELRFRYMPCLTFSCGILLFSGSLTLHAVWKCGVPPFLPPAGGILLILGWLSLIVLSWIGPGAKQAVSC
jgi:uncharacterized membrane protein YgdD (TMEM256/DUF423 family)